jgi:hypothetical protein
MTAASTLFCGRTAAVESAFEIARKRDMKPSPG